MNKCTIKKISISVILSTLAITGNSVYGHSKNHCDEHAKPTKNEPIADIISDFFTNNIILATGINFFTGESVILDPLSSTAVTACNDNNSDTIGLVANAGCTTDIVNPSPELASAIASSNQITNGTINKNGQPVQARFVVTVAALYEGSNCITIFSGGKKYEKCTTDEDSCKYVAPLTRYGNKKDQIRKDVRKFCANIPENGNVPAAVSPDWKKTWRSDDCKKLKGVYLKNPAIPQTTDNGKVIDGAVTYNTGYRQYIWDSCHTAPGTGNWGQRP